MLTRAFHDAMGLIIYTRMIASLLDEILIGLHWSIKLEQSGPRDYDAARPAPT